MWETGSIFNTYGHMGPSLNIENHFRVSGTIFKGSAKSTYIVNFFLLIFESYGVFEVSANIL